jgi:SpoVK/Ycf46/Vps4 family AAA+-type ATPase
MLGVNFSEWLNEATDILTRDQIKRLNDNLCSTRDRLPEDYGAASIQAKTWAQTFIESFSHKGKEHRWLLELWIREGFLVEPEPEWMIELMSRFDAHSAHTFILHFNINDYVFDPRFGMQLFNDFLLKHFGGVHPFLIYNRSEGLTGGDMHYDAFPLHDQASVPLGQMDSRDLNDFARSALASNSKEALNRSLRLLGDPTEALYYIERMLRDSSKTHDKGYRTKVPSQIVLFEFSEKLFGSGEHNQQSDTPKLLQIEALERWALDRQMNRNCRLIILLARNLDQISEALRRTSSGVEVIEIPLPNERARLKYLSYKYWELLIKHDYLVEFSPDFLKKDQDRSVEKHLKYLARISSGLNRRALEDILMRAIKDQGFVTLEVVKTRREDIIKTESANLLEVVTPHHTFQDLGGLTHVQKFLKDIVKLMQEDSPRKENTPPGILFLGPPGTGKSATAEAMADAGGASMVKLGNIRGGLVGQSESNLSLALRTIRAMAPVIVFMDEIDQTEGMRGGQGDGGVDNRMFAMLLTEMSNRGNRGNILWIAASNRPDLIDPAMRRAGRFDDKIPFLVPRSNDRHEILERLLKRQFGRIDINTQAICHDKYDGFTGAEIESIVTRAARAAALENSELRQSHFDEAMKSFVRGGSREQYELMACLALQEVSDGRFLEHLPDNYKLLVENRTLLDQRILELSAIVQQQKTVF